MRGARLLVLLALATAARARADGCPRTVEVRFAPVAGAQIACWIEDASGAFVDTVFVTRSTGMLGLGNRPGNPLFKSDYRWPYGARTMALPVWAHARGRTYRRVVMGGASGVDDNDTIGNHFGVSSPEPFYCSPSGGLHRLVDGVDVVTCASPFFGSKGLYAKTGSSVYPPRADLVDFTDHDSVDAENFAGDDDVAAISGATPAGGAVLAPPLRWTAPAALADGEYAVLVEVNVEADFNAFHQHPSVHDEDPKLDVYGHDIFGQPSIVWRTPIVLDGSARVATAEGYSGYGDWDGASGALHPPDGTITTGVDGSGEGRLLEQRDGDGTWRVKATTGCGAATCSPPAMPAGLALAPADGAVAVTFAAPAGAASYEVRYRIGSALTDEAFALGTPATAPPPGPPGAAQSVTVTGLAPDSDVWIGVRALAGCGAPGAAAIAMTRTRPASYATLHGCFVATAAWGSALAPAIGTLRRFRDRVLLGSPMGRLGVAVYYAFSPAVAGAIAGDERLRAVAREAIEPVVRGVEGMRR